MAKNTKHDPLEAAKITTDRAAAENAALGETLSPITMHGETPPGQFVQTENTAPDEASLREDGPTIEEWIAAGYRPEHYPPSGYAEKNSPGLSRFKVGGPIDQEWIDQARAKLDAERDGTAAPVAKKIVYVVTEDGRGNCGNGQINFFRKGTVLELAGHGERGIQRLIDSGLKLKRQEH